MRIGKVVWSGVSSNNSGMNREVHVPLCERLVGRFRRPTRLFAATPRGAKASMLFYSLIMTCKANNIEPFAYFDAMLKRLPLCTTEEDYEALLPYNIIELNSDL